MTISTTPTGPLFAAAQLAASGNSDAFGLSNVAGDDAIKPNPLWEVADANDLAPRWDKSYPFQLMILERKQGKWQKPEFLSSYPEDFTLPIAPQSLDIDMPFAMQVEASQGGVIEQANGAPFREINLTGTTGVLPLRGVTAVPSPSVGGDLIQGIFAGTVQAARTLAVQGEQFFQIKTNVIEETEFEAGGSMAKNTGFYQFMLLKRYLEWYAEAKKTLPNIALGLAVWKEQEVYLVTPQRFRVTRSNSGPLMYNYQLSFRAWRRLKMDNELLGAQAEHHFVGRDPNLFAQLLNGLDGTRRALENSRKLLYAVRADVNNVVFGTLRQAMMFVRESVGTGLAVTDLPQLIYQDFKEPLLEKIGTVPQVSTILARGDEFAPLNPETRKLLEDLRQLSIQHSKGATGSGNRNDGLTNPNVRVTANTNFAAGNPANKLFRPELAGEFYDFWSRIDVQSINLRPATIEKIDQERRLARNLHREDFEKARDEVLAVLADYESAVGAGSSTYASVFGPERPAVRQPTEQDWDVIFALGELSRIYDALAASRSINRVNTDASVDYVAGLARQSGIAFTRPTSKFLVPFPYGFTLEQLAARYLGSPDRWMEIATLNGLSSPYVDEVGFVQTLLVNGAGNDIVVPDSTRYYTGQPVWVSALGIKREKRRVSKIQKFDTYSVVTLDGAGDLGKFTVALQSVIQAFLPDTTNSLQWIYIPSTSSTETDWLTKSIPGIDVFDPYVRIGGVDLLLDNNGDYVIGPDGTTRLAVGLTNLIQRVKIGFGTPLGSLPRHPEFGFGIEPGTSTADVSAEDALAAAKAFIKNEQGFAGVEYAAVKKTNTSLTTTLMARLAGIPKTVPITVQLR